MRSNSLSEQLLTLRDSEAKLEIRIENRNFNLGKWQRLVLTYKIDESVLP